ncbi:MAG TPA: NUDIX hydrolase [Stellaceae bacterium]|nr:NUDIX hydrolase [Stellaceae bacterium]
MQDIVNAVFVRSGRVLLSRRSAARRTYPNCWSFPGGHVEPGESLDEALTRELREEVGVTPTSSRKLGTLAEPAPCLNGEVVYHFYAVSDWAGGEPRLVGDEHSELRWFSISAACALPDLALLEYSAILRKLV